MTALLDVGAGVGWPDGAAATAAHDALDPRIGRLGELVEWYAATRGGYPPSLPGRARCVLLAPVTAAVAELAATLGVGVGEVALPADVSAAFAVGASACDDEIEAGTDLIVLAGHDDSLAAAVAVAVMTGAEPVALLPRGAQAVDSDRWIAQAGQLRDARRRLGPLRTRPDEFLTGLGSPVLAAAAGVALRAAGRRTPVVLDGTPVLAAACVCLDSQSRARQWWQVADSSPDRVHTRAVDHLGRQPLLDLGTGLGDGTAGLLAVALLQAAVRAGASP